MEWTVREGYSWDVCEGRGCLCLPPGVWLWEGPPSLRVRPNPWRPPVSPLGALRVRCLAATGVTFRCTVCAMPLRPPPTRPESFGGQRRTSRSTVWPRRPAFGDQRRTFRSTVWGDRNPPLEVGGHNHFGPRGAVQPPIIGVSKPSHQPIRNETFRIGNSRRLLIKRAFEEVGTRRKKGKGVNPPSGTRRGRPRNDATAEAERFSL